MSSTWASRRTCATGCLRFHVHICSGICERRASEARYAQDVAQAVEFLSSNKPADLIRKMKRRMWEHAAHLEFERAQRLKEQIVILESALEKQVVERDVEHDSFSSPLASAGYDR